MPIPFQKVFKRPGLRRILLPFTLALVFIGIVVFVALTAWDTNQLKKIGQQIDDHPHKGGLVVIGALKLYLDYINLFLLLLRARSR